MATKTTILWRYYIFFFVVISVIYQPAANAGLVTDFIDWRNHYQQSGLADLINGKQNSIKSFYQFTHLLMYGFTNLFGANPIAWHFLFTALFALNGFLIYRLFTTVLKDAGVDNAEGIVLIGVLFFLVSPYQAEVVVWKACLHYLTGFAMALYFALNAIADLRHPTTKRWLLSMLIFTCSVFSLEFFLLTPVLTLILLFFYRHNSQSDTFRISIRKFVIIPFLLILGYFIVYKLVFGRWVAHYGAEHHEKLFHPDTFSTFFKYAIKYLILLRHWNYQEKEAVNHFLDGPIIQWGALVIVLSFVIYGLIRLKKWNIRNKVLLLCMFLFMLYLMPAATFHYSYLLLSENDRLGFMASAFLLMGFSVLLSRLPRRIYYTIACVYIGLCTFPLFQSVMYWKKSEFIFSATVQHPIWHSSIHPHEQVLFLNAPDNFMGIPIFKSWNDSSDIWKSIRLDNPRISFGSFYDVAKYNMTDTGNGVHIVVIDSITIRVIFNQWGNWWWNKGIGAGNYENQDYQVIFNDGDCGNCYTLRLKNLIPRSIIFQTGFALKKVNMKAFGIEQW
ncbi:hypothetical protein [Sediminibacterium soli]|uniref:hypothetical protein n=1 Tax=Sediminibacterium soli TaxID=2698829 RepID=UPI00137B5073|nr:hypothetical protein [Sediminibacterium soli]NCI48203.1 hypothetical protein [Sediminibacterium soli]